MNAVQLQPAPFVAHWTEQNLHLRERRFLDLSASEIIQITFADSTFWMTYFFKNLVRPLLGRVIVPASNISQGQRVHVQRAWENTWQASKNSLRQNYRREPICVRTPDGVEIRGTFYRSLRTQENDIHTIIVSQPNGVMYKTGAVDWILEKGSDGKLPPFHLVAYDYRGVGESGGVPLFANQLALDGESIHQCVHEQFRISEGNIRHFGRSLGGAVSAIVRAIHAGDAPYVNSHSFSSLLDMVHRTDLIEKFVHGDPENVRIPEEYRGGLHGIIAHSQLPEWLITILQAILTVEFFEEWAHWLLAICGWDFNVEPSLQTIGESALVIYDPEDGFMQNASAHSSVADAQRLTVTTSRDVDNHHNAPPSLLIDGRGEPVTDKMLAFLLQWSGTSQS